MKPKAVLILALTPRQRLQSSEMSDMDRFPSSH